MTLKIAVQRYIPHARDIVQCYINLIILIIIPILIRSFLHKCRDDPVVLEPASVAGSEYQVTKNHDNDADDLGHGGDDLGHHRYEMEEQGRRDLDEYLQNGSLPPR